MKPLKPVMAALLAAASATFASPGTAFALPLKKAPAPAQEADCLKALDVAETDPVNALTCLVQKKPEARKDIGERLAAFVQGTEPGRQYLTDALLKDEQTLKLVAAEAKGWPAATAKKKPADVAVLYFVVGPESDTLPAWAQVKALQGKLKPKMGWSDRLAAGLTSDHWSDTKQVAQQDAANGTNAFLNAAAVWAHKVMDDPRTKTELGDSVKRNDTTAPVVPTVDPGVGGRLDRNRATFGAGFTTDELYRTGAVVARVFDPKDDGYRELSMKIYTVRNDDGSMQNMIGIVDITDPSRPYKPQFIPVTASGVQKIALRDGGRPYEVNIDGDNITMSRAGTKPGAGASLSASMSNLYNLRADQARNAGTVRVPDPDGAEYYAISQGNVVPGAPGRDARGDLLLFPKSVVENPQSDPRLLRPASIVSVRMVDKDGVTVPVTWSPDMGKMPDGLNPDGSQKMSSFKMIFDVKAGMWKAVRGVGDADPAKPVAAPPVAANPAAGTTPPAGSVTAPDGKTPPPTADMATLDQIVTWAKQTTPPWSDADNSGLSPEAAAKVHIMTSMNGKDRVFGVFFDPSLGAPGNQYAFAPQMNGQPLKSIHGVGKYVVMQYPQLGWYFDYSIFGHFIADPKTTQPNYVWAPETGVNGVEEIPVVMDMLRNFYPKVDPKLEATLRANIKQLAPNGGYKISGNATTLSISYGKDGSSSAEVWPKIILTKTGNNDGMTEQKGPGTIYTLAGGGNAKFQETVSDGNWSVKDGGFIDEAAGYALYVGKEAHIDATLTTKMYKRYAIMFRFKKNDKPVLSKLITVFGDAGDPDYYAKPADLHMTGLPDTALGDTALLRMFVNSTPTDGAISAYTTPASPGNAKDPKRNCAGPVVWWGISQEAALAHCQSDSKTSD